MVAPGYEVIILGNSNVGKSSLLSCYVNGKVTEKTQPTVGVEFLVKTIADSDINAKLKIWDTAGEKRFQNLLRCNLPETRGALVVYDIHDRYSYRKAREWVAELQQKRLGKFIIALVGNKTDIAKDRKVSTAEAKEYAKRRKLIFKETSA
ncbi:hypothetical protein KR032_003322, partial [Drosophila birchii]